MSRVLIVDDRHEDLAILATNLGKIGYSCVPFLYDPLELPEIPYSGIRIAFFDINLENLGRISSDDDNAKVFSTLSKAYEKLIGNQSGPLALIFWTTYPRLVEKFVQFINERIDYNSFSRPLVWGAIDKNDAMGDSDKLSDRIEDILQKFPIAHITDFETKCFQAVDESITSLFNIVENKGKWVEDDKDYIEALKNTFSKMASQTDGLKHAQNNPAKSIQNSLLPVLDYNLKKNELTDRWTEALEPLSSARRERDLSYHDDNLHAKLNSIYHVDLNVENLSKDVRGLVIECLIEKDKIKEWFGIDCQDIKNMFFPFESRQTTKDERREIFEKMRFVFVEISAACDHAQKNKRLKKYVWGVLCPFVSPDKLRNRGKYIWASPAFNYNDEICQLLLNCRFVLGFNATEDFLGTLLFRLKESLTNQLSNYYADYSSRIGIIQFS